MAKPGRGGTRGPGATIAAADKDLDYAKVGASFSKLGKNLQDSINRNMKLSDFMKKDIQNGRKNKATGEWTTGFAKSKIKIITDIKDGKPVYSIKQKNKYLKRNVSKAQAANYVARFYLENMR